MHTHTYMYTRVCVHTQNDYHSIMGALRYGQLMFKLDEHSEMLDQVEFETGLSSCGEGIAKNTQQHSSIKLFCPGVHGAVWAVMHIILLLPTTPDRKLVQPQGWQ